MAAEALFLNTALGSLGNFPEELTSEQRRYSGKGAS